MEQNVVFRIFTIFDGYGAPISLTLHGKWNIKNIIGAVISILMIVLSLLLSTSTFMDYVNETNPTVTTSIKYGTSNLTFNYSNFFFAISFFEPNRDNIRSPSNSTNNYADIMYINQLNMTCTTCNTDFNPNSLMNLCAGSMFTDVSIKSLSSKKSAEITSIFDYYSFCLPQDISGVIEDVVDDNSNLDSTLQVMIPYNNISIYEVSDVRQNTATLTKPLQQLASPNTSGSINTSTNTTSNPFYNGTSSSGTRRLQSKSSAFRDLSTAPILTGDNKAFYQDLISIFNANIFPKILIMHRSVEINTGNSDKIINLVYNLDVLDYKDSISGNPNVYDVYVQKYSVVVEKGSFLTSTSTIDFLVVKSIQKNSFSSSTNNGSYLTFKLYSDTTQITVEYVMLTDFLSSFGSYYSILSLIARILSLIYNGFFFKKNMINSIFKFIDNEPDPFVNLNKKQQAKAVGDFYNKKEGEKDVEPKKISIGNVSSLPSERSFKKYEFDGKKVTGGMMQDNRILDMENGHAVSPSISSGSSLFQKNCDNSDKPISFELISLSEASINKYKENRIYELDSTDYKKDDSVNKHFNSKTDPKNEKFNFPALEKINENTDIEKLQKQYIKEREYYKKIIQDLKWKKKEKHRVYPTLMDIICMRWGCKSYKNRNKKRYEILEKCGKIIDTSVEINNLIKKMFELDFMKKLLLTDTQRHLLKFQYRYLNLKNYDETMKFLDIFDNTEEKKLDKHLFDNIDFEEKIDVKEINEQLLEGLKNYYNF